MRGGSTGQGVQGRVRRAGEVDEGKEYKGGWDRVRGKGEWGMGSGNGRGHIMAVEGI